MVVRHFREGEAHAGAWVAVDHLALGLEDALIPENPQADQRAIREWIERVDVAAAEANFRCAGRELRAGAQVDDLRGGDERTALHGAARGVLRGLASSVHLRIINGHLRTATRRNARRLFLQPYSARIQSKATMTLTAIVQVGTAGVIAS